MTAIIAARKFGEPINVLSCASLARATPRWKLCAAAARACSLPKFYTSWRSRECVGCGVAFSTQIDTQERCNVSCGRVRVQTSAQKNKARTIARAEHIPEFVGVDGEGVTHADGSHSYVLLSVGEQSLHRDGAHLEFGEIIQFLWDCFLENPDAVYCGYYLGYDFTQWLRTLPRDRAEMLLNPARRARTKSGKNTIPFPVFYGDTWEFDLLGMKRFKVRRVGSKQWLYICDVGSFFQQPFATAILGWQDRQGQKIEIATADELAIIERGKAQRATAQFDKAMIEYNVTENRVLARMMGKLAAGFKDMGVTLRRDAWFGPGQVAQKWMDQHSTHAAKHLIARAETDELFRGAIMAARAAYYGGWFETMAHGHIKGNSYEYDIASAYPHIHSQLPCLLHGTWEHCEGPVDGCGSDYVLVRADVRGENPNIGAMLHRDAKGRINRPAYSSGWYWLSELHAAARAGLVCEAEIYEAFIYRKCDCPPPMRDLRGLFQMRLEVGKATPQGRGLRITYNSCYGKTAQSIGTPKHANSIHASLITSGCRTMICDAIATHPGGAASVVMIATDGIYFDAPHPGLQNQPAALGNWEETIKPNLSIFLPGVYWDDVSRASREKKAAKLKSRGVSGADLILRLDALDAEFDRMLGSPIPWRMFEGDVSPDWWAKLTLPLRFSMISPKQALQRNNWELAGQVSQSCERELWAHPRHKRELVCEPTATRNYIHSTVPQNRQQLASVGYDKAFGMDLENRSDGDMILTPEGDAISDAYEILRGD